MKTYLKRRPSWIVYIVLKLDVVLKVVLLAFPLYFLIFILKKIAILRLTGVHVHVLSSEYIFYHYFK